MHKYEIKLYKKVGNGSVVRSLENYRLIMHISDLQ